MSKADATAVSAEAPLVKRARQLPLCKKSTKFLRPSVCRLVCPFVFDEQAPSGARACVRLSAGRSFAGAAAAAAVAIAATGSLFH